MYNDKTIVCKDCGTEFIFTAAEQEFYAEKGFTNEPQRCKPCRNARKNAAGGGSSRPEKVLYDVICAECGRPTQVPFQPKNDRPVYCRDCFANNR
jgi:CxxC-x17-CxxC domain-containing protein